MTIPGRGDLMPARRHGRRNRGGVRTVAGLVVVLLVLAAAGYGVWWHWFRTTNPKRVIHAESCHHVTPQVAPAQPSAVRVKVLNTTSRSGLAATTRQALVRRGFVAAGIGNATPQVAGAMIRYPTGSAGLAAAKAVAEQVPDATLRPTSVKGAIELEIGRHWHGLSTTAEVRKARRKDEQATASEVCIG